MSTKNTKTGDNPKGDNAKTFGGVSRLRRLVNNSALHGRITEMPDNECISVRLYPNISTPALFFDSGFPTDGSGTAVFAFDSIGSFQNYVYFRIVVVRGDNIFLTQKKWGDIEPEDVPDPPSCNGDPDDFNQCGELAPPQPGIG